MEQSQVHTGGSQAQRPPEAPPAGVTLAASGVTAEAVRRIVAKLKEGPKQG